MIEPVTILCPVCETEMYYVSGHPFVRCPACEARYEQTDPPSVIPAIPVKYINEINQRIAELELTVDSKTDAFELMKATTDRYKARITELEAQIAKLQGTECETWEATTQPECWHAEIKAPSMRFAGISLHPRTDSAFLDSEVEIVRNRLRQMTTGTEFFGPFDLEQHHEQTNDD